jgi:hypothetical protein
MFTADIKVAATNCKWFKTLQNKAFHPRDFSSHCIPFLERAFRILERHAYGSLNLWEMWFFCLLWYPLFALFLWEKCCDAFPSNCYLVVYVFYSNARSSAIRVLLSDQ